MRLLPLCLFYCLLHVGDWHCVCVGCRHRKGPRLGGEDNAGSPPVEGEGEGAGQSAEMLRLLRQPRYFDDDFAAVRGGGGVSGFREARRCAFLP